MEESGTPAQEVRPASLDGSATEKLNLTEETTNTYPVHGTCEDINVVHSAVTNEENVSPKGSMRWVCPMCLSLGENWPKPLSWMPSKMPIQG